LPYYQQTHYIIPRFALASTLSVSIIVNMGDRSECHGCSLCLWHWRSEQTSRLHFVSTVSVSKPWRASSCSLFQASHMRSDGSKAVRLRWTTHWASMQLMHFLLQYLG